MAVLQKRVWTEVEVSLRGTTPYSPARRVTIPKDSGEGSDAHERRTWPDRMHVRDGHLFIPKQAIKGCLYDCAKFLSESVPGKGKATWTKHIDAGVMMTPDADMFLYREGKPIVKDDIEGEELYVPSDGTRGGSKRVTRFFPRVPVGWEGRTRLMLIDPMIADNPEKIKEYFEMAGLVIGLGRWRRRRGGDYGGFVVTGFDVLFRRGDEE